MKSEEVWFRLEWSKTQLEQANWDRSDHSPAKNWLVNFTQEYKNKLTYIARKNS